MSVESLLTSIQYVSVGGFLEKRWITLRTIAYMPKTTIQMIVRRIVLMMRPRMWENPIHAR